MPSILVSIATNGSTQACGTCSALIFRTFLFTLLYYLYGDGIYNYYIAHHEASETFSVVLSLSKYHKLISFLGYSLALVLFVMNLKKGYYKSQFAQFGITHVALLLVVIQAFFVNSNILEGLIWYIHMSKTVGLFSR